MLRKLLRPTVTGPCVSMTSKLGVYGGALFFTQHEKRTSALRAAVLLVRTLPLFVVADLFPRPVQATIGGSNLTLSGDAQRPSRPSQRHLAMRSVLPLWAGHDRRPSPSAHKPTSTATVKIKSCSLCTETLCHKAR